MRSLIIAGIFIFTFANHINTSFGQTHQDNVDDVIECWENVYNVNFDFKNSLNEFEQHLLDKKIIKNMSITSYKDLFNKLKTNHKGNYNWLKVNVDRYLPSGPFKHCMKLHTPPKDNNIIRRWVYLFSIYHILSKDFATINIKAFEGDSILINGVDANLDTFKQMFKVEFDVIIEQQVPKEEVCVNIDCKSIQFDSLYVRALKEKIDDYHLIDVNYIQHK